MNTISARWLYITFLPAAIILATIAAVSVIYQIPIPKFTRDVAVLAQIHPFSGLLSSLGILLWCATASICLFSAGALRSVESSDTYRFLLISASLSIYLLFDDLFQFHEYLAQHYLGIGERAVFLFLGLAVSGYLIVFRNIILRTNYLLLLLALGLFTLSIAIDALHSQWRPGSDDWNYFVEDGAKWLGIVSWCSYYSHTSLHLFVGSPSQTNNAMQSGAHASRRL